MEKIVTFEFESTSNSGLRKKKKYLDSKWKKKRQKKLEWQKYEHEHDDKNETKCEHGDDDAICPKNKIFAIFSGASCGGARYGGGSSSSWRESKSRSAPPGSYVLFRLLLKRHITRIVSGNATTTTNAFLAVWSRGDRRRNVGSYPYRMGLQRTPREKTRDRYGRPTRTGQVVHCT